MDSINNLIIHTWPNMFDFMYKVDAPLTADEVSQNNCTLTLAGY